MKEEERIGIFKEQSGKYRQYLESVRNIDDQLEIVRVRMENVHSPNLENIAASGTYNESPMIELIEQKSLLEEQKNRYLDLIQWIENLVDSVYSSSARLLIWMTYVQRRSLNSIAEEYSLRKALLYKIRRKYLIEALTDERIAALRRIQNITPE